MKCSNNKTTQSTNLMVGYRDKVLHRYLMFDKLRKVYLNTRKPISFKVFLKTKNTRYNYFDLFGDNIHAQENEKSFKRKIVISIPSTSYRLQ